MSFDLEKFCDLRPFAFHFTSEDNLSLICATRHLESAAKLIEMASRPDLLKVRRQQSQTIDTGGKDVRIQSQGPLHAGNFAFEDGWNLPD